MVSRLSPVENASTAVDNLDIMLINFDMKVVTNITLTAGRNQRMSSGTSVTLNRVYVLVLILQRSLPNFLTRRNRRFIIEVKLCEPIQYNVTKAQFCHLIYDCVN